MHTPGPWRVSWQSYGQSQFRIDTPRGTYLTEWDSTASIGKAEHDANARLIAQAPAMLAVLRALLAPTDIGTIKAQARAILRAVEEG